MKAIKGLFILLTASAIVVSCGKSTYRKTPGGMPYQVFKSGDTQKVEDGNTIKVSYTQKVNDSVYFTNAGKPPFYIPVGQKNPYDISEVFTSLFNGDSMIATQMMDTFIKRNPQGILPQFKKGDRVTTYVKILGVFKNHDSAMADEAREKKLFQDGELAMVEKFLKDKNVTASKTANGVFVEIINPGTGAVIDSGKFVSLNYTGTSFSGVRFDSNMDTSFHHTEPLSFVVGVGQMLPGFEEGLKLLKQGGKGKLYIPSTLAYGASPQSPKIKPYESLVFDIEVLDVKDKQPAAPKEMQQPQPPQKIEQPQQ